MRAAAAAAATPGRPTSCRHQHCLCAAAPLLLLLLLQFKALKPVGDRVLVKVDKEETKSVGGVLLPTVAQSRPTAGAIVAAGDVALVKVRVAVCGVAQARDGGPAARTVLRG
jgi:chaperonin GroES